MSEIYLDHNASAPVREQVRMAVREALEDRYGNPSSIHRRGHRAKMLMQGARESVASLLGGKAEEIVFTSGGTESNNLAIFGVALARPPAHLIVTAVEHSSVLEPALELQRRGWRVSRVGCDPEGWVAPEAVLQAVSAETVMVSMMHSNHEVGTLQDVGAVAEGLRGSGVLLHCDAVQSAGKVHLDVQELGADLMSVSAHKIGGAAGVGCLWIRSGIELDPIVRGGSQETNRRAGTPALSLIAGFGEAARLAGEELIEELERVGRLRDLMEEELRTRLPGVRLHGTGRNRLPNTTNFALPGWRGEDLVVALDLEGIAISTGSACAAGTVRPSHVLLAMGCSAEEAGSALRVSLGHASRQEDVARFLGALKRIVREGEDALMVDRAHEEEPSGSPRVPGGEART
ncbi:MAG: cysteine desulfurase NifS [Acidobacteria bacterium]|nr:MAG: cysteine desulfurase NifS [Acidobacteriota bacterium]